PMRVTTSTHAYPIHFEADAGVWIADAIAATVSGRRIAIITDENVAGLHVNAVRTALEATNRSVRVHVVPAGETSKSLGQASRLYDALLVQELDRRDAVVAIGGGVVGDLAGFVASTFLRGIDFIQVPTTTLSCIDSSVGGKTGINTPRGKNLVGTFYPPKLVCIAGSHLKTLGTQEHAAGVAESIKVAACLDMELFTQLASTMDRIMNFDMDALLPMLRRSVALKAHVVSEDEKEQGLRAVLNFGHTIGHAIERGHNYAILHGEAVALGMIAEAEWADSEGISNGIARALTGICASAGLPTEWRNHRVDVAALRLDKKRAGMSVTMPVVTTLGQFEFKTVPISAVSEFVSMRSTG
ncbi:MAG: 3-dehydroquinate synthase, partial [Myxococcota bacterium]